MKESEQMYFLEDMMVLRECDIFEMLTPTELRRITDIVTVVILHTDETVIEYDDVHAQFYIVKEGALSLRMHNKTGVSTEIRSLGISDHIGGISIFLDYFRYPYEVVATTKTVLLSLKRDDLYNILLNNPSSALRITEFFARQLTELETRIDADRIML